MVPAVILTFFNVITASRFSKIEPATQHFKISLRHKLVKMQIQGVFVETFSIQHRRALIEYLCRIVKQKALGFFTFFVAVKTFLHQSITKQVLVVTLYYIGLGFDYFILNSG